ncbi:helix-turn-helix domain-containing protein [Massilia norwichensis]|uniref:Helix-turn-helix domain-containing protein n=1 Tax=Massilia norwichensis TaxID=1442366 RepID=A0ABT2A1X9_9BURK|nr:helix-turn-helix transcriptional regulator [Massilia norwichensis]MCS0588169.1 helix-turn-helix domain-containing protein [Massilia norwichensis]
MHFGERLKQIRTEKGLTQPQFAQAAGIEQSYLSKLENDKSVPSAEMFSTILAGLEMDAATFLSEVDQDVLATTLRHIPAVTQFTAGAAVAQIRETKKWLYGSAAAWVLGFAMMLAANDGIFFSNNLYKYDSPGILLAGEPENIFEKQREFVNQKILAKLVSFEEGQKQISEFQSGRVRPLTVESSVNRGTVYFEAAENGRRRFDLVHTTYALAPGNRILQYLGAVVLVSGFVGLFIEWRLRRLKTKRRSPQQ